MKNWIRVIFAVNNKLDALADSIDVQVEGLSSLVTVPTMELFDNIMRLNDKKVRLINLRVLHDKMKDALTSREYFIVMRSSSGASFCEIAQELGSDKGHIYRSYMKIIQKLGRILNSYGYNEERLRQDYEDITLVDRTYKMLAHKLKAS